MECVSVYIIYMFRIHRCLLYHRRKNFVSSVHIDVAQDSPLSSRSVHAYYYITFVYTKCDTTRAYVCATTGCHVTTLCVGFIRARRTRVRLKLIARLIYIYIKKKKGKKTNVYNYFCVRVCICSRSGFVNIERVTKAGC